MHTKRTDSRDASPDDRCRPWWRVVVRTWLLTLDPASLQFIFDNLHDTFSMQSGLFYLVYNLLTIIIFPRHTMFDVCTI
jgi:hypothetical protein